MFLRKNEFVDWKMSKAQGTAWCKWQTTSGLLWGQGYKECGGGAGDEVVQEGRGQVSQGFEYCDINCGYPLRNSEPFNGIIRCVFYKDHSDGMVLDRVGRQVPRS